MNGVTYTIVDPIKDPEIAWISGRDIMPLIEALPTDRPVGIEIGVDEAPTSWYLLKSIPGLRLYGVDPYLGYQDWYPGGWISQESNNQKYEKMRERLAPFGDRWKHYRLTSDDALPLFQDDSYDFIFIDGLHEYDQVLKDCRNYWPKIKSGGVFSGHDYKVIEGVGRAVDEFAAEVGATVNYLPDNDAWYWIKP
jgi:hypothetical protein